MSLIKYGALALGVIILAGAGYSAVSSSPETAAQATCCCGTECACVDCKCTCAEGACSCESCCCDGAASCDCGKEE